LLWVVAFVGLFWYLAVIVLWLFGFAFVFAFVSAFGLFVLDVVNMCCILLNLGCFNNVGDLACLVLCCLVIACLWFCSFGILVFWVDFRILSELVLFFYGLV